MQERRPGRVTGCPLQGPSESTLLAGSPLHHSNYSLQRSQVNNRFGTADYFVLIFHIIEGKKNTDPTFRAL